MTYLTNYFKGIIFDMKKQPLFASHCYRGLWGFLSLPWKCNYFDSISVREGLDST